MPARYINYYKYVNIEHRLSLSNVSQREERATKIQGERKSKKGEV